MCLWEIMPQAYKINKCIIKYDFGERSSDGEAMGKTLRFSDTSVSKR